MLDLDEHTVALLAAHKKAQAELKMKNRTRYKDFGLVFAREWTDLTTEHNTLGLPLPFNTSGKGNTLASSRRVAFARSRSTRCDTRPRA